MFEVYTYFGRVLSSHVIGEAVHHDALENARNALLEYERQTGKPAWVRFVNI